MQSSNWKWHLDEVFMKINGERHYLWRIVDHEGEVFWAVHEITLCTTATVVCRYIGLRDPFAQKA
jgi:hypothetical protein